MPVGSQNGRFCTQKQPSIAALGWQADDHCELITPIVHKKATQVGIAAKFHQQETAQLQTLKFATRVCLSCTERLWKGSHLELQHISRRPLSSGSMWCRFLSWAQLFVDTAVPGTTGTPRYNHQVLEVALEGFGVACSVEVWPPVIDCAGVIQLGQVTSVLLYQLSRV